MRIFRLAWVAQIAALATPTTGLAEPACDVGLYGSGAAFVALTQTEDGLSYNFSDGTVGDVARPEARIVCKAGAVLVDGTRWPRQALRVTDTVFDADGVALAGRLIEPPGGRTEVPLVVYAHGSEQSGWLDRAPDPYQMVGRGLSVFVYDKRGTGASEGRYSQNVPRLAADLALASAEARRLARGRFGRFGLVGLSQGGWVATYAADAAEAEFVIVGYGLAVDILEEDATEVELALREAGYGADVIAQARRITDATARIATTGSTEAVRALEPLRAEFAGQPWVVHVEGDFTGLLFRATTDEILTRLMPYFESLDVDWSIDPVAIIDAVKVPQLWVLAGADREAPVNSTFDRLQKLKRDGQDLTIAVFPETDHGMWLFEEREDGRRDYTRIAPGYHDLVADWIKNELREPYGNSEIQ